MNAYIRMKLTVTENEPTRSRMLTHPEIGKIRLDQLLALYGWHGAHHVAHIDNLRQREGWRRSRRWPHPVRQTEHSPNGER